MRELVNAGEVSFGVQGVWRDKKTKKIISETHVHHVGEIASDLADQILERLRDKTQKGYSSETVLIINCVTNTLTHEPEWYAAIKEVRRSGLQYGFREVFLVEGRASRTLTL